MAHPAIKRNRFIVFIVTIGFYIIISQSKGWKIPLFFLRMQSYDFLPFLQNKSLSSAEKKIPLYYYIFDIIIRGCESVI